MRYDEIKRELNAAGRLVDDGKVAEAEEKIRAMAGKGLSRADIDANLTEDQIEKLREYEKSNGV